MSCVVACIALDVDVVVPVLRGSLPALIYSGGTGLHGKSELTTLGVLLQPGWVVSL